jgi:hypothetical protein
MRVRGRCLTWLGLVVTVALVTVAPASAVGKPLKNGPDLAISDWKVDQGKPYFIRVVPGGGELFIKVTTENLGDRKAKPSVTLVGLTHNGDTVALKEVKVPGLKPHEASTESATLHVEQLGWMVPRGLANATKVINETDTRNNGLHLKSFRIPAIADTWTIDRFETKSEVPGDSSEDTTLTDGAFHLSHYDSTREEWVYQGYGTVDGSSTYNPAPQCSGSATSNTTVSPSKLTNDTLRIARDLTGYTALIATSKLPGYTITINCGAPFTIPAGFADLNTAAHIGTAFEPMKEDDQTLSGSFPAAVTSPGATSTISWKFSADL